MPCAGLRCKPPLLLAIADESAPTGTVAPTFAPPVQAARCVEFSRALSRAGQSRRCDLQTRGNADRECDHARISVSGPGSGWAACHDGFGWKFFLHGPATPSRPNTSCPKTISEALSHCDPILESSLLVSELTGLLQTMCLRPFQTIRSSILSAVSTISASRHLPIAACDHSDHAGPSPLVGTHDTVHRFGPSSGPPPRAALILELRRAIRISLTYRPQRPSQLDSARFDPSHITSIISRAPGTHRIDVRAVLRRQRIGSGDVVSLHFAHTTGRPTLQIQSPLSACQRAPLR